MSSQPEQDVHARAAQLEFELQQFREHFPDAMVEIEIPSLRVTYMSKMARAVLGYSQDDVEAGLSGSALMDATSLADAAARLAEHMAEANGGPYQRKPGQQIREYVGVRKDGSTFPVELQTAYILDRNAQICGARMTFRDVTERHENRKQLERSKELLAAIVHSQSAFIRDVEPGSLFDGLLQQLVGSAGAEEALIAELVAGRHKQLHLLASSGDAYELYEAGRAAVFATIDTHGPGVFEEGTRQFLSLPLLGAGGLIGVVCLARVGEPFEAEQPEDVGPLLDAVGAIIYGRRSEIMRRESNQSLDFALQATAMALVDADLKRQQVTLTTSGRGFLGHPTASRILPFETWQAYFHEDDVPALMQAFEEHLAGRLPTVDVEGRYRAGDGSWRWVHFRGGAIERDAAGRPLRAAGTMLDVTDRHAAQEQRLQLERTEREAEKLSSVGAFASEVAHDFNNLLTTIAGNLFLLKDCIPAGESSEQHEILAEASAAVERGTEIVRRLVAYARPELAESERSEVDGLDAGIAA